MHFADPAVLALLLLPAGLALNRWHTRRRAPAGRLGLPAMAFLDDEPTRGRARWQPAVLVLRLAGIALLVIALARPQIPKDLREIRLRSRNIMLALDISSSMKAGD